jgi:DNA-binding NarL/FixJ family response regulator
MSEALTQPNPKESLSEAEELAHIRAQLICGEYIAKLRLAAEEHSKFIPTYVEEALYRAHYETIIHEAPEGQVDYHLISQGITVVPLESLRIKFAETKENIPLLTAREVQVLRMSSMGCDRREIATVNTVSIGSIDKFRNQIKEKFNAVTTAHTIRRGFELGILNTSIIDQVRYRNLSLSDRELEVLELVSCGKTEKAIAEQLYWSRDTIWNTAKSILTQLGARNMAHATGIGIRAGLIKLEDEG